MCSKFVKIIFLTLWVGSLCLGIVGCGNDPPPVTGDCANTICKKDNTSFTYACGTNQDGTCDGRNNCASNTALGGCKCLDKVIDDNNYCHCTRESSG